VEWPSNRRDRRCSSCKITVCLVSPLPHVGPHVGHEGEEVVSPPLGRMRKRDIVRYYGRRMIRKVGKRPRVFNIAKR